MTIDYWKSDSPPEGCHRVPLHTYGSPALAAWRYRSIAERFGEEHPAALAALGRWHALLGHLPGRLNEGPQLVAWHRQWHRGTRDVGYMNRGHRRALARQRSA